MIKKFFTGVPRPAAHEIGKLSRCPRQESPAGKGKCQRDIGTMLSRDC